MRVPTATLVEFFETFDDSPAQLASTLGITTGTIQKWLKAGEMPRWTAVALEGLIRKNQGANGTFIVANVDRDNLSVIKKFLDALGCRYSVVPVDF